jgi:hypothetical protein
MSQPIKVPDDTDAGDANRKYGERYGVDWEYEGLDTKRGQAMSVRIQKIEAAKQAIREVAAGVDALEDLKDVREFIDSAIDALEVTTLPAPQPE